MPVPAIVVIVPSMSICRIRLLSVSAITTRPSPSTAIPLGFMSCASSAGPPSPENPGTPVPAIVSIVPSVSMRRIRAFCVSTMNTRPMPSTATAAGNDSSALVATPPSPPNPGVPVPATLVRLPSASTRSTRWLSVSAMNARPRPSTAIPCGSASAVRVASISAPTTVDAVHAVRLHASQPSAALWLPSSHASP